MQRYVAVVVPADLAARTVWTSPALALEREDPATVALVPRETRVALALGAPSYRFARLHTLSREGSAPETLRQAWLGLDAKHKLKR